MLQSGKLNILIDGQFGSTGKGLVASYVAQYEHVDIAVTNASANAGHTFFFNGKKRIVKHLPVAGVVQPRSTIYLCAGAIIHPPTLLREIAENDIAPDRVVIHPRCAIITDECIAAERCISSGATKIASTQSGVGRALVNKINRAAPLAVDIPELRQFIRELDLQQYMDDGCTVFMEVPQGMDLSISSGLAYPFCTSREITVSGALTDAQVHPSYLGVSIAVIRTFPIRVGHLYCGGVQVGDSGPFYEDSVETTWEELSLTPEVTTVTGRVRRVASFSMLQYKKMLRTIRPDYVFLTFANYLSTPALEALLEQLPEVTHISTSPFMEDITHR